MTSTSATFDLDAIGEEGDEYKEEDVVIGSPLPTQHKVPSISINDTYEYSPQKCAITPSRLAHCQGRSCSLNADELAALADEQHKLVHADDKHARARVARKAKKEEELRVEMIRAMARARSDHDNDVVLGVQPTAPVANSLIVGPGAAKVLASLLADADEKAESKEAEGHDTLYKRKCDRLDVLFENKCFDAEDVGYVRKPNLANIVAHWNDLDPSNRPKYTLRQVLLSRRFHLYKHRFANAQYERTLLYPTLCQPCELFDGYMSGGVCAVSSKESEKDRTRQSHRFVLAADTQFGILMDGYAMENPNWGKEIDISRKCVAKINAMSGKDRPLFVCVCGDLVDTESSFSRALASWKKVMSGWERNLVFEQQVKDFKRVWSRLDPDIALVCLCGNHDVGNRPTKASIEHWTSSFGDDFFAFWANGTFNIALNNCLFSDPTGAPDLFEKQLVWLEEKLAYAKANNATHIFVYGHFPWFLRHEEETDDEISTFSAAPGGWGPAGAKFPDGYFTIPYEQRKMAMVLFRKYGVTACFSGHFHQNVVAETSWGMPMIVTGPLSMTLRSQMIEELSRGEPHGIGMRLVDVGEKGEFFHKFMLLE